MDTMARGGKFIPCSIILQLQILIRLSELGALLVESVRSLTLLGASEIYESETEMLFASLERRLLKRSMLHQEVPSVDGFV